MFASSLRVRGICRIAALGITVLVGCRTHPTVDITDPTRTWTARFLVAGDQRAVVRRGISAAGGSVSRCTLAARFEGTVLQRHGGLEVAMPVAWIAVTRNNDKQWDDFHFRVEAGGSPAGRGLLPTSQSRSETLALSGTVDTAVALLTTWQSQDTLRVSLPWTDTLSPRRLHMFVEYHAFGETGARSTCDAIFSSDTLVYPLPRSPR
jgi:hypothetical protein